MHCARWFTTEDQASDEALPNGLWSPEAVSLLEQEAFCTSLPQTLRVVEENTLPSWLWRHVGQGALTGAEHSVSQVIDRIAGSTAYAGWKKNLFYNESSVKAFYDELRWLLAQRALVVEPLAMAGMGLDWAYDLKPVALATATTEAQTSLDVTNSVFDTILSGTDNGAQTRWQRFLSREAGQALTLHFADTAREWATPADSAPRALLDLTRFCRDDGTLDAGKLEQATRLAVVMLDLHYEHLVATPKNSRALAIGFANLADILMRQGIAYDSAQARATAAAISAIMTAAATETSAKLAQKWGCCDAFAFDRTSALRSVANRRRAAYGDTNDYEHLSVLPAPLVLADCPDLTLVAEARRCWDEAWIAAQRHGLRHTQTTQLFTATVFSVLLASSATSIGPETSLVRERALGEDRFLREIHPAMPLALARMGYTPTESAAIIAHVLGHRTLENAPGVNRESLAARGFDSASIAKIDAYVQEVNDIRLACTPWIVGEAFCQKKLGLSPELYSDFNFDLLSHLGFAEAEIIAANHYCYGHGTVETATELKHEHRALFITADDCAPSAQIAMAAAVQGFIGGGVDLTLDLPTTLGADARSALLIDAWKSGLKALTLAFTQPPAYKAAPREAVKPVLTKPHRRIATGKPAPQSAEPKAKPALAAPVRRPQRVGGSGKAVALTRKSALRSTKSDQA